MVKDLVTNQGNDPSIAHNNTTLNDQSKLNTSASHKSQNLYFQLAKRDNLANKQIINDQNFLRQDVSFIKEGQGGVSGHQQNKSPQPSNLATIMTTGDQRQDMLGSVLGMKHLGKCLIDLPQTFEDLQLLLQTYFVDLAQIDEKDQDECLYEAYLEDHFKPSDLLDNKPFTLSQYQKEAYQSKYLNNQSQGAQSARLFNIKGSNSKSKLLNIENPLMVDTKPDSLKLIRSKILKDNGGEDAFNIRNKQDSKAVQAAFLKVKRQSKAINEKNMTTIQKMIDQRPELLTEHQQKPADFSYKYSQSPLFMKNQSNESSNSQVYPNNHPLSLGNPSSRQDALLLQSWYESMLSHIQNDLSPDQRITKQFPLIQIVLNIVVKELTRQVSVQCLERGQLLHKVFSGYIRLIDLINKDYKIKRKKLKKGFATKLDKYIGVQDDQLRNYKQIIDENQIDQDRLKKEIEYRILKGNNDGLLITKLKKKSWNTQKDLEAAKKKIKILEQQNKELQEKLQDMAERNNEKLSDVDEGDQRRMYQQIEEELEDERVKNGELGDDQISEIPTREIIQEDDKYTDMIGFDLHLRLINADKTKEVDIQTEKVTKRHIKTGVNSHKLGLMKDKETFIDPRMFQGEGSKIYTSNAIALQGLGPQNNNEIVNDLSDIREDDSETSSMNRDGDEEDEGDSQLNTSQLVPYNLEFHVAPRRCNSANLPQFNEDKKLLPKQTDSEKKDTRGRYKTNPVPSTSLDKKRHRRAKSYDMVSQFTITQIPSPKTKRRRKSPKVARKAGIQLITDVITKQMKSRLKELLNSNYMNNIQQEQPEFYKQMATSLDFAMKEVAEMNKEIRKKDKQLRFQRKLNKSNSFQLSNTLSKADNLELENYLLKEFVGDLVKSFDEQEKQIDEIMVMISRDSIGQMTVDQVKKSLGQITEKISQTKTKTIDKVFSDDIIYNELNKSFTSGFGEVGGKKHKKGQSSKDKLLTPGRGKQAPDYQDEANQKDQDMNQLSVRGHKNQGVDSVAKTLKSSPNKDKKKHKMMTKFMLFNLGYRKVLVNKNKGSHPANQILKKILAKSKGQIKDIMPRKMLLRVISQVYSEKLSLETASAVAANTMQQATTVAAFNQTSSSGFQPRDPTTIMMPPIQSLLEYVYDSFMQKYGLKNVAEKKFVQLLQACIINNNNMPRIRLFGRFMECYDELQSPDYNKYQELTDGFVQQILNFKIEDDDDVVLLPFNKAVDSFRFRFEGRFITSAFQNRIQKLERMKVSVSSEMQKSRKHLKYVREAVDLDAFAEFIIDNNNYLQAEKENMIRDVFYAMNMDNEKWMELTEFTLLMKIFHYRSQNEIQRLYEDYSDIINEDKPNQMRGYSLDSFQMMALEKDLFLPKHQLIFIQTSDYGHDYARLIRHLDNVVKNLKNRLLICNLRDNKKYLKMIDNFVRYVKDPYSSRVGWITYRIIDEIFKRLFIKKLSENFMAIDLSKLWLKLKPSPNVISKLPESFYDTQ